MKFQSEWRYMDKQSFILLNSNSRSLSQSKKNPEISWFFTHLQKCIRSIFIEWVWQAQTISHMYFEGFLIFTVFTEIFYSFVFDLMIAIEEVKQVWCEQKVSAAMRGFILIINWTLLSSASFQILMITKGSFALLENCYQEYMWQSWTRI